MEYKINCISATITYHIVDDIFTAKIVRQGSTGTSVHISYQKAEGWIRAHDATIPITPLWEGV